MSDGRVEGDQRSDADLIAAARADVDGGAAYAELYRRHVAAARAAARALADRRGDIDDLVSEGFARVLDAIRRGGGPELAFRPYLLTCVRNVCFSRARSADSRVEPAGDLPDAVDATLAARADLDDDRALVVRAFASLPERWQVVLWHTEIESRPAAEVAPLLGIAPNAVAALSYRAREGLREAYLQAHLQRTPPASCGEARLRLGGYARESLSTRDRQMVEQHLERCDRCRAILVELRDVATSLRSVVAPVVLGAPLASYLAKLHVGKAATLVGRHWSGRSRSGKATAGAAAVAIVALAAVSAAALNSSAQRPSVALGPAAKASPSTTTRSPASTAKRSGRSTTTPAARSTATARTAATAPSSSPTEPHPSTLTTPAGGTATTPPATVLGTRATPATTARSTSTTSGGGFVDVPGVRPPTTRATTVSPVPVPVANLSVQLSPIGPAVAGHDVYLSAVVTNDGPDAAEQVSLAVTLPGTLAFEDASPASWSCSPVVGNALCTLARLEASASSTVVLRASAKVVSGQRFGTATIAPATDVASGRRFGAAATALPGFTVTATVSSKADDPISASDTSAISLDVTAGGLSTLYADVDRGDIVIVGDTLMTCDVDPCTDVTNNDRKMVAVNADSAVGVTASSSAELALPADATVTRAWLVWGARESKADALAEYGTGRITIDGTSHEVTLGAAVVMADSSPQPAVTVRADVTEFVDAHGSGTYTFAATSGFTSTGTNLAGGWSLVVVTHLAADPERVLVVTDGLVAYDNTAAVDVPLGGLGPATDPVLRLGAVGWDGDRGSGDRMSVSVGSSTPVFVTGAGRPSDDVMTSRADGSARDNTLGFDAFTTTVDLAPGAGGLFAVAPAAPVVGGALTLHLTGDEQVWLGVLTLAVPT